MESHLLQMRGLKRMPNYSKQLPLMSHLLQMRGLKHFIRLPPDIRRARRIFYRCVD